MTLDSVNNLFVDGLCRGNPAAVETLLALGYGAFVDIDRVEIDHDLIRGADSRIQRHSLWFWIHQAPQADAVALCWDKRMGRELEGLLPQKRAELLLRALTEAFEAGVGSAQWAPCLETWERLLEWVEAPPARWNRDHMLTVLRQQLLRHGDRAAPLLLALNQEGHVVQRDASAWLGPVAPDALMETALQRGYPALVQALLDVAGPAGLHPQWLDAVDSALAQALSDPQWASAEVWANGGARLVACANAVLPYANSPRMPIALAQAVAWALDSGSPTHHAPGVAALRHWALQRQWEPEAVPTEAPRRRARL